VQPNTSGVARAGLIRIDSKYVTITQSK
jgi:hypothetical protein